MLDWLMLLSQLALWVFVVQLYRSREAAKAEQPVATEHDEVLDDFAASLAPVAGGPYSGLSVAAAPALSTVDFRATLTQELEGLTTEVDAIAGRLEADIEAKVAEARAVLADLDRRTRQLRAQAEDGTVLAPLPLGEAGQDRAAGARRVRAGHGALPAALVESGLDTRTIARTTGRQQEEVDLLLRLAAQGQGSGEGKLRRIGGIR